MVTLETQIRLSAHAAPVMTLALGGPGTRQLASGDESGKVLIWSTSSLNNSCVMKLDCVGAEPVHPAVINEYTSPPHSTNSESSSTSGLSGLSSSSSGSSSSSVVSANGLSSHTTVNSIEPSSIISAGHNHDSAAVVSVNRDDGYEYNHEAIGCLKYSTSRPHLLYASCYKDILVWDTRHLTRPMHKWTVGCDDVNAMDLLESEQRLAVGDDYGQIHIVDLESGQVIRRLSKHDNIVSSVKFRPNRPWQLISGGMDSRLVVSEWRAKSGLAVSIFEMPELLGQTEEDYLDLVEQAGEGEAVVPLCLPMVHCLDCTPSGSTVVCGLESGSVELFSGSGKTLLHQESLFGHISCVACVQCVQEEHMLSGGNDSALFLWQLCPEGQNRQFQHSHKVGAIAALSLDRVFLSDTTNLISVVDVGVL